MKKNSRKSTEFMYSSGVEPKTFLVYCPQLDKLYLCENIFALDVELAMNLLKLGLKNGNSLEFIGEL